MRGYAICTEPRSGSTLLCRLLESTGVLGVPTEYFNAEAMRGLRRMPDYPRDAASQVEAIPRLGATANGVYGLKLFSRDAPAAAAARWTERLPGLSFVFLERRDLLGQAISHVRSLQTGKWSTRQVEAVRPVYIQKQINDELVRLATANARWRYFFARNGLPVLNLIYEEIAGAQQEAVDAVAEWIGVSEATTADLSLFPHMTIQRDALNEEWRERFVSESRDLTVFP